MSNPKYSTSFNVVYFTVGNLFEDKDLLSGLKSGSFRDVVEGKAQYSEVDKGDFKIAVQADELAKKYPEMKVHTVRVDPSSSCDEEIRPVSLAFAISSNKNGKKFVKDVIKVLKGTTLPER